jgi:hypothetical protein
LRFFNYILIGVITSFIACSNSSENTTETAETLATYTEGVPTEMGAVIACAASGKNTDAILTFYYVEAGIKDVRLYETENTNVDANNLSNYRQVVLENKPIFGGDLQQYTQNTTQDKWLILSYVLDNEIKLSNPILTKQNIKPTVWADIVNIDQGDSLMPQFTWQDNLFGENAIYFQIVSDASNSNRLISGTYTLENNFQYYKLDNVVLNITKGTPDALQLETTYQFTLMDVSEDNWVNVVTYNKMFEAR